ncbi:MAG: Uma2 family endonuclease [Leptolyngbyaceae bacterium]|nr:Uma2 family endonuclease [Leptolyngbyaceae bacterium]
MWLTAQELEKQMPDATQLLSDEPEMESSLHYVQLALLVACLERLWGNRTDFFIGATLTIYFSRQQLKNRDFRGPDFFLVKNTERRPRNSWVVWEEDGQYPNLIIELLSNSTSSVDKGLKKTLYSERFGTPEYFWFSPETLEFEGFRLSGKTYAAIPPTEQGWRWSEELELYLGIHNQQLRYFDPEGQLIPTPDEAADLAVQQAELESQRAELESQRAELESQLAERLAERLRSLGIDPDEI